jgi:hypothetical protein
MSKIRLAFALVWLTLGGNGLTTIAQDQFTIDRSTIESWVFQRAGDAGSGKRAFEAEINLRMNRLERYTTLSDEQRQQIKLAAQGDIKRFYDQVEEVICKVEKMKLNQGNFNEAYMLTVPLQNLLNEGIFGPTSLFAKVSRSTMSDEQRSQFETAESKRARYRSQAMLRTTVRSIALQIPLTAKQQQQLFDLASTRFEDTSTSPDQLGLAAALHVMNQPEQSLAEFLDAKQLQAFAKLKEQIAIMQEDMGGGMGIMVDPEIIIMEAEIIR